MKVMKISKSMLTLNSITPEADMLIEFAIDVIKDRSGILKALKANTSLHIGFSWTGTVKLKQQQLELFGCIIEELPALRELVIDLNPDNVIKSVSENLNLVNIFNNLKNSQLQRFSLLNVTNAFQGMQTLMDNLNELPLSYLAISFACNHSKPQSTIDQENKKLEDDFLQYLAAQLIGPNCKLRELSLELVNSSIENAGLIKSFLENNHWLTAFSFKQRYPISNDPDQLLVDTIVVNTILSSLAKNTTLQSLDLSNFDWQQIADDSSFSAKSGLKILRLSNVRCQDCTAIKLLNVLPATLEKLDFPECVLSKAVILKLGKFINRSFLKSLTLQLYVSKNANFELSNLELFMELLNKNLNLTQLTIEKNFLLKDYSRLFILFNKLNEHEYSVLSKLNFMRPKPLGCVTQVELMPGGMPSIKISPNLLSGGDEDNDLLHSFKEQYALNLERYHKPLAEQKLQLQKLNNSETASVSDYFLLYKIVVDKNYPNQIGNAHILKEEIKYDLVMCALKNHQLILALQYFLVIDWKFLKLSRDKGKLAFELVSACHNFTIEMDVETTKLFYQAALWCCLELGDLSSSLNQFFLATLFFHYKNAAAGEPKITKYNLDSNALIYELTGKRVVNSYPYFLNLITDQLALDWQIPQSSEFVVDFLKLVGCPFNLLFSQDESEINDNTAMSKKDPDDIIAWLKAIPYQGKQLLEWLEYPWVQKIVFAALQTNQVAFIEDMLLVPEAYPLAQNQAIALSAASQTDLVSLKTTMQENLELLQKAYSQAEEKDLTAEVRCTLVAMGNTLKELALLPNANNFSPESVSYYAKSLQLRHESLEKEVLMILSELNALREQLNKTAQGEKRKTNEDIAPPPKKPDTGGDTQSLRM